MYKSKNLKDIKPEQGVTRTGAGKTVAQARMQKQAAMNGRWNKGALPAGANRTRGGKIGQMNSGR